MSGAPASGVWIALVLGAVGTTAGAEPSTAEGDRRQEIVRAFVAAFNRHDVERMVGLVDDSVQWLSVDGTKLAIEADGRTALRESMTSYFASCPTCRSAIESIGTFGSRIVVLEVAQWTVRGERREQRALAVYEFRGDRILRVHYFAAE